MSPLRTESTNRVTQEASNARQYSNSRQVPTSSNYYQKKEPYYQGGGHHNNADLNAEFISFQPSLNYAYGKSDMSLERDPINISNVRGSLRGNYPSTHHNPLLSVSGDRNNMSGVDKHQQL
jgi:hypothetical protein